MARKSIVGRKREQAILQDAYLSKQAEFIAVYGRRRVGKTYLVRNFFSKKGVYLETTGIKGASLQDQLENFAHVLSATFFEGAQITAPKSWKEMFELLTQCLERVSSKKRVVIFLDELPWLVSPRSGLLQALDFFWNRYWSSMDHLVLIVCGSAASWMLKHVVNAKGGLYNRLTKRLFLEPFNLQETKAFLQNKQINFSHQQIVDLYMVFGGIPFYLNEVKKGKSVAQVIQSTCFEKNGLLYTEFENIFRSLFEHSSIHLQIVREIGKTGNLLSRNALIKSLEVASGGRLKERLDELEASGFIRSFLPLGKQKRDLYFRIIDEYTLFYLKWVEPLVQAGAGYVEKGYWSKRVKTPQRSTWAGYAFEGVCLKHVEEIARALGIDQLPYRSGSWRFVPSKGSKEEGVQIDLLFDREDGCITLCEVKYRQKSFAIDKEYARKLLHKMELIESCYPTKRNPTKKRIQLALITSSGFKPNIYSVDLVQNVIVLDDLFKV